MRTILRKMEGEEAKPLSPSLLDVRFIPPIPAAKKYLQLPSNRGHSVLADFRLLQYQLSAVLEDPLPTFEEYYKGYYRDWETDRKSVV